jgi:uncharacterized protein YndB with AHSA1/START domain
MFLFIIIVGVLFAASSKPDSCRSQRSTMINAPAEKIFALINDFHEHEAWSPWEKVDPQVKRTYSGNTSGPGAVYAWDGNREVGQGRMEITESVPHELIKINIDFFKPFEAHNKIDYTLESNGLVVTVTQAMYGPQPLSSKIMTLFFSMEKMVGTKFEEGLSNLKTLAEK